MRLPAKKYAGCPNAPRDFPPRKDGFLPPPLHRVALVGTPLSLPQSLYGGTGVREYDDVKTKISHIDRLPDLLTHGVPLGDFAR